MIYHVTIYTCTFCILLLNIGFNFKLLPLFLVTEEQISAMRKELEKYGIQMPAFSKIGGILESEV